MNQTEASSVLGINLKRIKILLVEKKIKPHSTIYGKIDLESVYEYKKELDERRKVTKPKWIKNANFT